MKQGLTLLNKSTGQVIVNNLMQAENTCEVTRGLLGKKYLEEEEGLFLPDCRLIHSFFMQFSFTAVYIDTCWRPVL
jgi:hypothetical protein